jgi:hypothetical protein
MAYVQPPSWPVKDPDALLDYDIDWSPWLGADTISSSVWVVEAGTVVVSSDQFTNKVTKVWLQGGVLGEHCRITNRIVTAAGRTDDRTVKLDIKAK